MERLTIDYFSNNQFIINERYWIYFNGDLYIYDIECQIEQDIKKCSMISLCKKKFDTFGNYITLIRDNHPVSIIKETSVDDFCKDKMYSKLFSILKDRLSRTNCVKVVDGYYNFSLAKKSTEEKYFALTHNLNFDKIEFMNDENCQELKKYIKDNQLEIVNDKLIYTSAIDAFSKHFNN